MAFSSNVRIASPRIVVAFHMAMVVVAYAPACAENRTPGVARAGERYVIQPGAEALFGAMLGAGETLPGGCTLTDGKIERVSVLATYGCGDARVVLQLVHPTTAPSSAVRTERFAVATESGTPPAGLVDAVADRIRARETGFEWTVVENSTPARRSWPIAVAAGAVVAIVALWILRRATRRRRSD